MAQLNTKTLLYLAGLVLVSALIVGQVAQSDALPSLWKGVACAKDYMVRLVRDKVISKSTLVREYNATMARAKYRYGLAEANGELEGKDEEERENFYYKITVEELRELKSRIESGSIYEKNPSSEDKSGESSLEDCYDPDAMVENWDPDNASMDEEDEKMLLAELDELERQAKREEEMGWSLSEEAREALRTRTKAVLTDLLNNEVRQIALAVLTAYLSGGSLVPTILNISGDLKYKLADFFMNAILDLVSAALGRRVDSRPPHTTATTNSAGAGAATATATATATAAATAPATAAAA